MDRLIHLSDAQAFIRTSTGVYKQVDVYRRGDKAYVQASGGYLRICVGIGGEWPTSHPGVKVIDFDIPGFDRRAAIFKGD